MTFSLKLEKNLSVNVLRTTSGHSAVLIFCDPSARTRAQ